MTRLPLVLSSNRPADRFYRGGRRITDFRGEPPARDHEPEDWIASTTSVFGQPEVGPTVLPDGRSFAAAVAADPESWLGAEHVSRWADDPRLLVKLLDAGQRLPVHAHPDGGFAHTHLGRRHGKAEAWYILRGGTVFLGLRQSVTEHALRSLVDSQQTEALLATLNPVEVQPGDAVFVPAGQLHAIGEGVLLLEVQEPEDLSILLEWRGFDIDGTRDGHLGLGFDTALQAVDLHVLEGSDLESLIARGLRTGPLLPSSADSYFRLERIEIDGRDSLDAGFAVVVVESGALDVAGTAVRRGTTLVAPHAAGRLECRGTGVLLVCRPPSAAAQ